WAGFFRFLNALASRASSPAWYTGCSTVGINTMRPEETMAPEPVHERDEMLRRVRGEFLEMPGLRLTEAQARRLCGLDEAACGALLCALVDAKFLFRTNAGAFMRVEHTTPARASL